MAPNIVPTMLQQIVYHIYSGCLLVAILAPILTYGLKPKRRKAAIIQCLIEIIFLAVLIINIVLAMNNNVSFWQIINGILGPESNAYGGMIFAWLMHFVIVGAAWFKLMRKRPNDQQESQKKKLPQPPQPIQE